MEEQCRLFFDLEEPPMSDEDTAYVKTKYDGIMDRLSEIDASINEKTRGWTTDRMSRADLTIIRLGVYEMLYDDDVPPQVAVNEAVELAKRFGRDESYSFVNGVLSNFLKE